MNKVPAEFRSFSQTEHAAGFLWRPHRVKDLNQLSGQTEPWIVRGAGLSYVLASAGERVTTVDSCEFDRFVHWDQTRALLTVETGMSLGQLTKWAFARGYYFPVLPGYPLIRVGGSIGSNVHGKSQFHDGHFSDWISELEIFHPQHGLFVCGPDKDSDVFNLTLGGFGLTGHVRRATLRLKPIRGTTLRQRRVRVNNLVDAAHEMRSLASQCDQIYSWHDLSGILFPFGSGFIFSEKFVDGPPPHFEERDWQADNLRRKSAVAYVPFLSTRACATVFHVLNRLAPSETEMGIKQGAFPIVGKEIYFQQFRRCGFIESQVIIPFERWTAFVEDLRNLLKGAWWRSPVTLASLKIFQGRRNYLHFRQEGICFSIDMPYSKGALAFLSRMDDLTIRYGGIPNISKDSRLTRETAQAAFGPEFSRFESDLNRYDPARRLQSRLRTRLGL